MFHFSCWLARTCSKWKGVKWVRIGHSYVVNLFSVCHRAYHSTLCNEHCLRERMWNRTINENENGKKGMRQARARGWKRKKRHTHTHVKESIQRDIFHRARPFRCYHTSLPMCSTSSGYLLNHVNLFKAFSVQYIFSPLTISLFASLALSLFFSLVPSLCHCLLCSLPLDHFSPERKKKQTFTAQLLRQILSLLCYIHRQR